MKKLLNTLYVTTQGAWLARERENVLVRIERETRLRLPIHTLGAIVCFGQVSASAPLMGLCAERGVGLAFLTERGRFLARVHGSVSGNVLLRREQYRRADDDAATARIVSVLVATKIANSRTVLQRALRDRPDGEGAARLQAAVTHLASLQRSVVGRGDGLDSLRGSEGAAARAYFGVFNDLITHTDPAFCFDGRSRRPPLDPLNALLSFLYTLLRHDIASALEVVGLDPAVGYLHRDRPERPGLAIDLMEELRAFLVDRLVLSLINRRQLKPGGFTISEDGAVMMNDEIRKAVLVAYQERKADRLRHPFLGEELEIGLIPHIQARLFARYLRGDLDAYPAFIWR
ncbi:type I-C CRISPR-associated endonuclease Cas1c [endosymbiont of Ridgeia piscesae]|jgi:CRISPR-associated protein Cas1|uniref:CRISPR-associated endonuclease Cas1 n=1 Tax=endosymbiont of Ridgeia piscesae TaxID=54398 RepID=A0A0T5ZBA2_9GAMM|nr:type I-C CRISPR-associated endonuclease Cas1c [endosymbiont of Ridgeia piscesae]KRT54697.1 CRISPR-associated protein, Cas1 family [endosymbiont of Ridgeia piscesae]KRT60122.1 CRISPR-associated protein, Cas1 family [endosymbiont of Ridgeia piscesae]